MTTRVPRINASEISNFLRTTTWGKKDIVKTFEEIWKRSFPNTYSQNSVKRTITEIDKYLQDNDLLDDFSEEMQTEDVSVMADQYKLVVDKIENNKKTELINKIENIESLEVKPAKKAELIQKALDDSNLDIQAKPTENVDKIKKQIGTATLQNKEIINRHYEGSAKQTLGIQHEASVLELYYKKTGRRIRENNEKTYEKKYRTAKGRIFKVVGRVDGFTKNADGLLELAEIKNRVNRLFKFIPDYEKLQMNYYFALTDTTKGELIEKYKNEIHIHKYEFNEKAYKDSLKQLSRQVDFLCDFVEDSKMLDMYKKLSYDDRKTFLDNKLDDS